MLFFKAKKENDFKKNQQKIYGICSILKHFNGAVKDNWRIVMVSDWIEKPPFNQIKAE